VHHNKIGLPMSELTQKRTSGRKSPVSAVPPKANMGSQFTRVRYGPGTAARIRSKNIPPFSLSGHREVGHRPADPGVIFLSMSPWGMIPLGQGQWQSTLEDGN
jgi:hypothetical protein